MAKKIPHTIPLWVLGIELLVMAALACMILWPRHGDVNGDGLVTITDYTYVQLDMVGMRPLTDAERARADLNNDGIIDAGDLELLRALVLEETVDVQEE